MYARHIVSAVIIGVFWTLSGPVGARSSHEHAPLSFSSGNVSREHTYRVDARVRPLLFWIRKSNVGDGRITWRTGPDGTRGYELLVGTDPARTPRRINRWGYLREESSPRGGIVFGVMSQSDEQSIEDATRNTGRAAEAGHTFKALHQRVTGSEGHVTLSSVRVGKDLTYADLGTLLAAVPEAPSRSKVVPIAVWTSPGFLAATASLLEEGRAAALGTAKSARAVRVYPYNGQLYELHLQSAERIDKFTSETRAFGRAVHGRFEIVNLKTRAETQFTVVYGVDGDLRGVPLSISFRPRWWLEVECVLSDRPGSAVATR